MAASVSKEKLEKPEVADDHQIQMNLFWMIEEKKRRESCDSEIETLEYLMNGCEDERRNGWDIEKLLHEAGTAIEK